MYVLLLRYIINQGFSPLRQKFPEALGCLYQILSPEILSTNDEKRRPQKTKRFRPNLSTQQLDVHHVAALTSHTEVTQNCRVGKRFFLTITPKGYYMKPPKDAKPILRKKADYLYVTLYFSSFSSRGVSITRYEKKTYYQTTAHTCAPARWV